jgi:beta-amylase
MQACIAGLKALKKSGVTGVVVDVWWGAVEADVPQQYHWEGYQRIVQAAHDAGLKVKVGPSQKEFSSSTAGKL